MYEVGTYQWGGGGQNKASSVVEVVENGKRETFGGGEFIHELGRKFADA